MLADRVRDVEDVSRGLAEVFQVVKQHAEQPDRIAVVFYDYGYPFGQALDLGFR